MRALQAAFFRALVVFLTTVVLRVVFLAEGFLRVFLRAEVFFFEPLLDDVARADRAGALGLTPMASRASLAVLSTAGYRALIWL